MVNQMKVDVVLELMDGRSLEAVLARPFIPEENEIRIMLAKGGDVHTYSHSLSLKCSPTSQIISTNE